MSTVLSTWAESNLLENSPFLPIGQAAAAQQSAPLELRSIVKEDGQYEFSFYDPAKKQSTWVRLNEPSNDLLVKAFNLANNAVTVEQHSRTYTLTLKEAKIASLATAALLGPPGSAGPGVAEPPSPQAQPPNRNAELRWINYQRRVQALPAPTPPAPQSN
jgi:hypothetical protein